MHELRCPKCGSVFQVDEADYASIVSQVRGIEFDAEIQRRIAELHRQEEAQRQAREALAGQKHQQELFAKDKVIGEKDGEILRLKGLLDAMGDKQKLAVSTARSREERGDCEPERVYYPASFLGSARRKGGRAPRGQCP